MEGCRRDQQRCEGEALHRGAKELAGRWMALEDAHEKQRRAKEEDGDDGSPGESALKWAAREDAQVKCQYGEFG